MSPITMTAAAALALLLVNVPFSLGCDGEGQALICRNIPSHFSPGYLTLLLYVNDVGEINSTVFLSSSLASVTRLRMDGAGVTGISEGAFSSFQNLTSVSLRRNALTQVSSKWFGRPAVLGELDLAENQVQVLNESMLDGLINLTKLSLDKNRIRTIEPNAFRSLTNLVELDLSENRMTRVSPQVFRSLRSTRVALHGNPWNCSCGAEDFVFFLKGLRSRSLLDRPTEVTCESPPPVRGRPVWNVSVCETSPATGAPSVTQTGPASSAKAVTTPYHPASATETSVQTKPTDASVVTSSHTATPPARPTPDTETPPDNLVTASAHAATYVTSSSSSETESFIPLRTEVTETCATAEPSVKETVCTLIVVIVVLCVLLFAVCFVAVQRRRNRSSKAVLPGRPKEERNESEEDGGTSSRDPSPGRSENRDSELAQRRPFPGVRAQSAHAVLFMAPFCASAKDQVTVRDETRAQPEDAQTQADGEQKLENGTGATGGTRTENTDVTEKNERQADENLRCVSVSADAVPYLSIGAGQNKPNPDHLNKQSGLGQRSQKGKVMGRVSTWPPTAVQWQARCKMKEEEEESETERFPGEVNKSVNKVEHLTICDRNEKEDEMEINQMEDFLTAPSQDPLKARHTQSPKLDDSATCFSEAHPHTKREDPATVRHAASKTRNPNQEKRSPTQDLKPVEPAHEASGESSSKAERRNEPKRAATGRHGAQNRGTGSKAPSGGASPDDETLLHGNEYAFMDLLHEVAQNNGRWTRERWKQTHVNKQRR